MYVDALAKLSQWDATLPPQAGAARMHDRPDVIKRLKK
jgi:hypothetical protein